LIPHIFHHVWVGPDPLPEEFLRFRRSWQDLHPGWEMRLWDEENLPTDFRRREIYDRLRIPAERSDMIRLEILQRFGGVYIDTDFECRRQITPLLDGVEFFAAFLKPDRVNNAILGSIPDHPLLDVAIRSLRPPDFHGLDKRGTGSLFVDRLLKEHPARTTIFPRELFYPATDAECEQAYAIHHYSRTWKSREAILKAARRAESRLAEARAELKETQGRLKRAQKEIAQLRSELADLRGEAAMADAALADLAAAPELSGER
jgi:mannosyltransferase OCH1-like enzyme